MNRYDHVGKTWVSLELQVPCSPCVYAVFAPGVDVGNIATDLQEAIDCAFRGVFTHAVAWEYSLGNPPAVRVSGFGKSTGVIRSEAEEKEEAARNFAEIARLFRKADEGRQVLIQNNPDNGKPGWWRVDGIRHSAIVRADSAAAAIEKAAGAVQDWESPGAEWIGEELPDVLEV